MKNIKLFNQKEFEALKLTEIKGGRASILNPDINIGINCSGWNNAENCTSNGNPKCTNLNCQIR